MKITADTNVLLRLVMGDDEAQGATALDAMERASLVAISAHSLCELAWVLRGKYDISRDDIGATSACFGITYTGGVTRKRISHSSKMSTSLLVLS